MKAMLFEGKGAVAIVDREDPRPSEGELLVRVRASGVCGTDRHIYHGHSPARPPVILGHEFSGEVVDVGPGVDRGWVGRRVSIDPNIYCGACEYCRDGRPQLCTGLEAIGVTRDGGFADLCVVPVAQALPVDDRIPFHVAAMAEPVACCLHGIDLAGIRAGQRVAVLGGGAIGLILAQLAQAAGAAQVVVSEPSEPRRSLATSLGLVAVAPDQLQATLPMGADVVIEAVGSRVTAQQALEIARRGGTIIFFGVTPMGQKIEIEPFQVYQKELRIQGSALNPYTQQRALALLEAGRVVVDPLITHRIKLDELPEVLATPATQEMVKVMVVWE
ncbi:MAG: zinc-dependent alcohol dehydrogenase family protein [Anaerolineae bacterium]